MALRFFAPIAISQFFAPNYREGSTSLMFTKIFSFFQSKPKAKAGCPQLVGHTQPVTTAKQALTDVWLNNSNCAIKFIDIGTELWHCGRIPSSEHIDNNLALWTTCNPDHQDHYVGSAKSPDSTRAYPPTKLRLSTVRKFRHPDPRGILDGTLHQRVDDFCTGFRMAKVQTVQVFKQCCNRFVMCRRHHSVDTHG